MHAFAKGDVVVLGPNEGESFWQPQPLDRLHRQQADAVQHPARQLLAGHPGPVRNGRQALLWSLWPR